MDSCLAEEAKVMELEKKIAGLQHLVAELLARNQMLRERAEGRGVDDATARDGAAKNGAPVIP